MHYRVTGDFMYNTLTKYFISVVPFYKLFCKPVDYQNWNKSLTNRLVKPCYNIRILKAKKY